MQTLDELVASGLVHASWADALRPVQSQLDAVGAFLGAESAEGRGFLPAEDDVLRVFRYPLDNVKVLIVGQDPYPTAGHPIGLSFAVDPDVRPVPRSLQNIYRELRDDLGIPTPDNGDLTEWSRHGVMLLNRVLTVRPGEAGSHRGKGWEEITAHAIDILAARGGPLVAILWGKDAAGLAPRLGEVPSIQSVHPSPLSASRGFFGSKPFSRANAALAAQGAEPVDWSLPDQGLFTL